MSPTNEAAIGKGSPIEGDNGFGYGPLDDEPYFRVKDEIERNITENRSYKNIDLENAISEREVRRKALAPLKRLSALSSGFSQMSPRVTSLPIITPR